MTLMMRPRSSGPTGTEIGASVSVTVCPRTSPSVVSMAMVRTVFSPRCWATSSTSRLPRFSVSSAFRMAGRCSSNCTSTTAPMTCRTLPLAPVARIAGRSAVVVAGASALRFVAAAGVRAAALAGTAAFAAFGTAGALGVGVFAILLAFPANRPAAPSARNAFL